MAIDSYFPGYIAQRSIVMEFDDKTGAHRDDARINEMFVRMRALANEYGFDLQGWGYPENIYKFYQQRFR